MALKGEIMKDKIIIRTGYINDATKINYNEEHNDNIELLEYQFADTNSNYQELTIEEAIKLRNELTKALENEPLVFEDCLCCDAEEPSIDCDACDGTRFILIGTTKEVLQ